jgi:hypothetical protein
MQQNPGGQIVSRKNFSILLAALAGVSCLLVPQPSFADGDLQKVNHIIIVMQENHSFDNYFGVLALAPNSPYRFSGAFQGTISVSMAWLVSSITPEIITAETSTRMRAPPLRWCLPFMIRPAAPFQTWTTPGWAHTRK